MTELSFSKFSKSFNSHISELSSIDINDTNYPIIYVSKIIDENEICLIAADINLNFEDEVDADITSTMRFTASELFELIVNGELVLNLEHPLLNFF